MALSAARRRAGAVRPSQRRVGPLTYALLIAVVAGSVFPLYWTFIVASQTTDVVAKTPPPMIPGGHLWENFGRVFDTVNFAKALTNSLLVSGSVTLSVVLFSSLAGFAFAKLPFRGKNVLLVFAVATMMVPTQLGIVPLYILMGEFGWTNDLKAVIVPFMVTAFGVFYMTQAARSTIPTELIEAARLDGCTTLGMFWRIVLPGLRPAAAVLGLFTFTLTWNDFMWPLVVLTPDDPTVQVALGELASGSYYQDYSLVLAGTALGTLPPLIVFALLGRQLISGIMEGAFKG